MNVAQVLIVLVLIGAANTAPLIAKKWLGERLAWPVDGHLKFFDGQPLLGHSKTVRGVTVGILLPALLAPLLGHAGLHGAAIGASAMVGDLLSSFVKRRMKLVPSSQALGLDQIPEVLLPAWVARRWFDLSPWDIVALVATFIVLALALSKVLYRLKLRDRPY